MDKKQKAFRGLLGAFCLSYMMLSYAGLALAQTQYSTNDPAAVRQYTGVESTIERYLCTPTRGNVSGAGGDLYSCIQKLYRFCVVTAAVGGLVYIVYSGYLYMSAGGSTEAVTAAKSRIYSVIIAFVILSMGYVFLKFLNPDLVEFRPIQPLAVTAPPSQLNNTATGNEQQVRSQLQQAGVAINQPAPTTQVAGLRTNTINELLRLKQNCGCSITLTGGSESGPHAGTGACNHPNGYKFDLGLNTALDNYITTHFRSSGTRQSDQAPLWTNTATGAVYAKESNHWDVAVCQ